MASFVRSTQDGPTSGDQDLNKSLVIAHKQNVALASENAALKEQLASQESSSEMEKAKILKALKSERVLRKQAQVDLKVKERETKELASENAALQEQLASQESSCEMEKAKILKALQSERALRKQARADLKAKKMETKEAVTAKPESQEETITILQNKLQDLEKSLLEAQNETNKMASEVTALKQQMATKESSWQQEKARIQQAADGEAAFRVRVQDELETVKKEAEEVINFLRQSLLDEQEKTLSVCEQLNRLTVQYEELDTRMRLDLNAEWETKWCQEQEKMALELQTRDENSARALSQVIQEKDDQIAETISEKKALEAENLEYKARLEELESKFIQSEAEWKIKLTTLEDQKRSERSAEEGSSKVLTQNKSDLQVCDLDLQELQQTAEKDKVELTKADIKAKKEAEKKLEKERKEKEKREKREKAEKEKQEKEELKRQKKEEKEREKREKKEKEKKEKEELKRQKKEKQTTSCFCW